LLDDKIHIEKISLQLLKESKTMGCGGAIDKAKDFKRKKDNKEKYKEPVQTKSSEYEDNIKLDKLSELIKAIEESDDVPTIIDKAGLKAASEEAGCKMKDFLGKLASKDEKIIGVCLECSGESQVKFEAICKLAKGESYIVKGEKLIPILRTALEIAAKIIPELVGGDVKDTYSTVDLDSRIPNWYRGRLDADIKKDDLISWIETRFFPEIARDSCARAAIPVFRLRKDGDKDIADKGFDAAAMLNKFTKKTAPYEEELNKKCIPIEKAMGLDVFDFTVLFDAAEYYNVKEDDPNYNDEAMKVVFEKAGMPAIYSSSTNHVKEILQACMAIPKFNHYNAIQLLALLYCKGDDAAKFEAFINLINDRDTKLEYIPGEDLGLVLLFGLIIFAVAIPSLAAPGDKSFERIDFLPAIQVWLLGKPDNILEKFKRDDLEKWYATDGKFSPCEGRKTILDFLKAHPEYVKPAASVPQVPQSVADVPQSVADAPGNVGEAAP
jgi:hypothetical protein